MADINGNELHKHIQNIWDDISGYNIDPTILQEAMQETMQQTMLINSYSDHNHFMVCLFSYFKFKIHYASANSVNYFNVPPATIIEKGIPFIHDATLPGQRRFFQKNVPWMAKKMIAHSLTRKKGKVQLNLMNWRLTVDNGDHKNVLIQLIPVKWNKIGFPQVGLMLFHNIKPYINTDKWWIRMQLGEKIWSYQSETQNYEAGEMISAREKEILCLIREGKVSKEIADILHISINTVDNHRRNMLQRTGLKDTTALVYISELTGIL